MNLVILLTLLWIPFSFSCATKNPKSKSKKTAQLIEEAKFAFDSRDFNTAVTLFSSLRLRTPDNPYVWDYLSQALLGRAGINLASIVVSSVETKSSTSDTSIFFNNLSSDLPKVSPVIRSDISEAIHVLLEYNDTHSDYLKQNEIVYRTLYLSYLFKTLFNNYESEPLDKPENFLNTEKQLQSANLDYVVDAIHQLNMISASMNNLTGKFGEKTRKFFNDKKLPFDISGVSQILDFQNGYSSGINSMLGNIHEPQRVAFIKSRSDRLKEIAKKQEMGTATTEEISEAKETIKTAKEQIDKLDQSKQETTDLKNEIETIAELFEDPSS